MIIPIYAGLERIPSSMFEASADLGGRAGITFRRVVLPLVLPAVIAGAIFTFSLTLGDYITPTLVSNTQFIGNQVYDLNGAGNQPLAAAYTMVPGHDHARLPARLAPARRVRGALMEPAPRVAIALRLATLATLGFIYVPIAIIVLYSFNAVEVGQLADPVVHDRLVSPGVQRPGHPGRDVDLGRGRDRGDGHRPAFGSLLALAVARHRFFGRESIAFIVILPLALPGIVTGLALNGAFRAIGFEFGLMTIVIGHATFCVVVLYNNAIARLRRTSRSLEEASADLGADTFMTFRRMTFPAIRTALVAGALLAFALSFDEIIVTNFLAGPGVETLPIWIFNNYRGRTSSRS